jgi:hypothetical protein
MEILIILVVVLVLDGAAWCWGVDSREGEARPESHGMRNELGADTNRQKMVWPRSAICLTVDRETQQ